MTPTRVTFVHARTPDAELPQYLGLSYPPTWALTLASHVPDDGRFELALADVRRDGWRGLAPSDLFLLSGWDRDLATLDAVADVVARRHPEARTILGGPIVASFERAGRLRELRRFHHLFAGEGEAEIAPLLEALASRAPLPWLLRSAGPFDLSGSRPLHRGLVASWAPRYATGAVELSRGCPYGCEFCDIRIQDGGSRTRTRAVASVVADLEALWAAGRRRVLLVCDNLMGDASGAAAVLDAIALWRARAGAGPRLFTWVSLDVARRPEMCVKMRRAGIDTLFIGVESFTPSALVETRKLQNVRWPVAEALRRIQEYGFIVVPGLIVGFDHDAGGDELRRMQDGLQSAGLLAGDPGFLVAPAGTPLHARMRDAGRLRPAAATGGLHSNIVMARPRHALVRDYQAFTRRDLDGRQRYERLRRHLECRSSPRRIAPAGTDAADVLPTLLAAAASADARRQLFRRAMALARPDRLAWAVRGCLVAILHSRDPDRVPVLAFWLFAWTTAILRYGRLAPSDIDVEGAPEPAATVADRQVPAREAARAC